MRCFVVALAVLGSLTPAHPVTISATVVDPGGDAVPGVLVSLVRRDNGVRYTTSSGDLGEFVLTGLPAGEYLVETTADRLTLPPREVTLTRDQDWRGELKLDLARVRSEVLVTATATAISSESTSMEALPLRMIMPRGRSACGSNASTPAVSVASLACIASLAVAARPTNAGAAAGAGALAPSLCGEDRTPSSLHATTNDTDNTDKTDNTEYLDDRDVRISISR